MTKRSAVTVALLSLVTCGLYSLIWMMSTKDEMNARGADIPPGWHIIIPILNILWIWKWCQGVEKVSGGKTGAGLIFAMLLFLGPVGNFMAQNAFNEVN